MIKITVGEDCGNAPKKAQLRDFTIAYANHDLPHLLHELTDDIRWNMVGDKVLAGKEAVAKALEQRESIKTTELTIKNVITHGNTGAVDGISKAETGSLYAFCDVYRFSSNGKDAKLKEITSYVIEL